jgi:hypothetical protein
MRALTASLCCALLAAPLAAQSPARPPQPSDFAWQWPIDTGSSDGALRFVLTPEVYARITRIDLADLVAFNGADEPIPLGPASLAFERLVLPPAPAPVEVALFRVPHASDAAPDERIALHIARGPDGRLTRLDAEVGSDPDAPASDVLLDVSSLDLEVTALLLELDALPADGLNARVEVAGSDDLAAWRVLASHVAVVSLQENGLRLERTRIELPSTALPYLRVRRTDADATLPLRAVRALPTRAAGSTRVEAIPPRQSFTLQGRAASEPGVFEYVAAGPFPVERVAVDLADRNSVAGYVLESRAGSAGAWIERARGTAFRIGPEDEAVTSTPIDIAAVRDRQWRLRTTPAQARAPSLALTWRPDQFVLLTQGIAPYRLAAGSASARRPDYPLRTVLSELRARHGDLWLPPEATLGVGTPLAGDVALSTPPPPRSYKQWILWAVLLAGAALVIGMVLKLMRTPVAEGGGRD